MVTCVDVCGLVSCPPVLVLHEACGVGRGGLQGHAFEVVVPYSQPCSDAMLGHSCRMGLYLLSQSCFDVICVFLFFFPHRSSLRLHAGSHGDHSPLLQWFHANMCCLCMRKSLECRRLDHKPKRYGTGNRPLYSCLSPEEKRRFSCSARAYFIAIIVFAHA